jgi:HEPN domain-containing protein
MSSETDPLAWIAYADDDYEMARMAMRRKRPITQAACFHAQQCAEKYLKAVLVAKGVAFPKTHDLITLDDLCTQAGVFVAIPEDKLSLLSAYAARVRYPGDEPVLEEAKDALATAAAVRRFVRKLLGVPPRQASAG